MARLRVESAAGLQRCAGRLGNQPRISQALEVPDDSSPGQLEDDLIELLDAQAAESGRSRSEVLAAAIRRGLGGGRLAETLAAYRTGEEISEDDAMTLAKSD